MFRKSVLKWFVVVAVTAAVAAMLWHAAALDRQIVSRFEGQRWALPTQVYARPLELYAGGRTTRAMLLDELERLGYQQVEAVGRPGQFAAGDDELELFTRGFAFWDGQEPGRHLSVGFETEGRIREMVDRGSGETVLLVRLDPVTIGSIYPRHGEDRVLLRLDDVPPALIDGLLAVEDRAFYGHHGVRPAALMRALIANLRAGGVVQGGSTITQQLVKNFYLDNRRTLRRKADEALMAVLLERRYDKDEILEAYLNEIYLGQDGDRAVHGFGLGSHFYFQRPLTELHVHELALLVGIIRGPSFYDPRRYPDRARSRRDLVLDQMHAQGALSAEALAAARRQPLGVADRVARPTRHPAFMGLVQRQLRAYYRPEDLTSEGLRIFTTIDPALQVRLERRLAEGLTRLEEQRSLEPGGLEGAVVVTDTDSGEVLALVGGRNSRFAGFNRALDARRPVGSLIKPFVYLTALERPQRFHAASLLEDGPMTVRLEGGRAWQPRNFDREWHGRVPLYRGLTESYNAATVWLGLEVGVDAVIETLQRAGMNERPHAYPSLLLGSLELTPLEVSELYQTLATGGFRAPPRAIREVTSVDGEPLQRHPLSVDRSITPEAAYLVNRLLQEAVRTGTGRRVGSALPETWQLAGKTGTSDGLRDSWFAGFGGDRLAVVWVGRDDNAPAGLTGAVGALPLWIDAMAEVRPRPLTLRQPQGVEEWWIDAVSGARSAEGCPDAVRLPFVEGTVPRERAACGGDRDPERPGLLRRLRGLFGG